MCSGSEAGSCLKLIDLCIKLESNNEEKTDLVDTLDRDALGLGLRALLQSQSRAF